jgi:hypothetical protein
MLGESTEKPVSLKPPCANLELSNNCSILADGKETQERNQNKNMEGTVLKFFASHMKM